MKVIFLEDVSGGGRKFDVKEVKDGYARNFLIPQKLAKPATSAAMREIESFRKKESEYVKHLEVLARQLGERSLTFYLKTDEHGSVFGSVTKEMILKGLRDTELVTKERMSVKLDHPLKEFRKYEIEADLGHGIGTNIAVIVQPQP